MIILELIMGVMLLILIIADIGVMVRINKRLDTCNKCYKEKLDKYSKRNEVIKKFLEENKDE